MPIFLDPPVKPGDDELSVCVCLWLITRCGQMLSK
jgi:hypothetical protein